MHFIQQKYAFVKRDRFENHHIFNQIKQYNFYAEMGILFKVINIFWVPPQKFPGYREEKKRCKYLHEKLTYIKQLIIDYDASQASCTGENIHSG